MRDAALDSISDATGGAAISGVVRGVTAAICASVRKGRARSALAGGVGRRRLSGADGVSADGVSGSAPSRGRGMARCVFSFAATRPSVRFSDETGVSGVAAATGAAALAAASSGTGGVARFVARGAARDAASSGGSGRAGAATGATARGFFCFLCSAASAGAFISAVCSGMGRCWTVGTDGGGIVARGRGASVRLRCRARFCCRCVSGRCGPPVRAPARRVSPISRPRFHVSTRTRGRPSPCRGAIAARLSRACARHAAPRAPRRPLLDTRCSSMS